MSAQQPTTNIETQKEKPKGVREWIQSDYFKSAIAQSLPKHVTPERFARICLTATMRTPDLLNCSKESVFKAMLDLSSLGLEPDGRRAHLIPFKNNKSNTYEVQLIIDYKGLIELAKRSGEVKNWRAELVCENDSFRWENGIVYHSVDFLKPRGKPLAVYSHVRNKGDIDDYEIMTLDEVSKIRDRSKAGKFGPWVTDFNEMAKKTVMRRHSKRLTLSPEFAHAIEVDSDRVEDLPQVTFEDLKPRRLSEIGAQAPIDIEPTEYQGIVEKAKQEPPQAVKIDPDAKVGNASLAKIMKSLEINPHITKAMLLDNLSINYKIEKLGDLKEWQVDDVVDFINSAVREPGSDDGELPDFDE